METFTWSPRVDATQETEPLIDIIQFGDGVEQRQKKGLRDHINKFSDLKFVADEAEIKQMTAFLLRHVISAFYFNFAGTRYLVRKDGPHSVVHKGAGIAELTVSFIEVVR